VKKGADVNFTELDGKSPLHIAAAFGDIKIIEYLLKKGGLLSIKDNN